MLTHYPFYIASLRSIDSLLWIPHYTYIASFCTIVHDLTSFSYIQWGFLKSIFRFINSLFIFIDNSSINL